MECIPDNCTILPASSKVFSPLPTVTDVRFPAAFRVIRLIDPPIASASISGVSALITSTVWIISAGIMSNWLLLVLASAEGILSPLMVAELKLDGVPRTCPNLASPISLYTAIPGTRFNASPIFESGNFPTWSDEITLLIFDLFFWLFNALACPDKELPITSISLPTNVPTDNSTTKVFKLSASIEISFSWFSYPMYETTSL